MIGQGEILLLLAILWVPVFLVAAALQLPSQFVRARLGRRMALIAAIEAVLALIFWLSPAHRFFPDINFSGFYGFAQIPLWAAVFSAAVVTAGVWALSARRLAP